MTELTIIQHETNPEHLRALTTLWGEAAPVMTRAQRRQAALLRAARVVAQAWKKQAEKQEAA